MPRIGKEGALGLLRAQREALGVAPEDCMMCVLAARRGAPAPIFESEEALVVLDRFGSRRGHLLVIAKQHVEDVTDLGLEAYLYCQQLAYVSGQALQLVLAPRRLFIAALGAPQAVPMSFPHFHLHVIPLFENDESTRPARVFSWTDGVMVYDEEEAAVLAEQLRSAFQEVAEGRFAAE